MNSFKRYNLFVFFTTFAKALIEVFIPIILYKQGYDIKEILLFLIIILIVNIIITPIANYFGNKTSFKILAFLSSFIFVGMYYLLLEKTNLFLLACFYSTNSILYYLARHNYAASVLKNHIGSGVGIVMIITILGSMPASFIGAIFINKLSIWLTILIVLMIYLIGIIPLTKIDIKPHKHDKVLTMLKKIPLKNKFFFAFIQFRAILFFLFPLYVFINIKDTLEFIGLVNIIVGIASIIFIYFYSKRIDKKKNDYMIYSSIFLSSIIFIEIKFATASILLLTSFFEGIATKMYEVSITRDLYSTPKNVDKSCYFLVLELLNNICKLFIVVTLYIFNFTLLTTIIILLIGILISGFVKYQVPRE